MTTEGFATQKPTDAAATRSRVPAVTWTFWVLKVLCTTVGETAADFLNEDLGLGLVGTTLVMAVLLVLALLLQFRAGRYVPSIYWSVVVAISVVGTLVTDLLTDQLAVPLELSTFAFGVVLIATFAIWHAQERTLSIRAIVTRNREAFYWTAVLATFALGTAVGDWLAEDLSLGYPTSAALFGGIIAAVFVAYGWCRLHSVAAFWMAYVVTRPFGASLGDYLAQAPASGGLGLGASLTSLVFVGSIAGLVAFLAMSKRDVVADA